MCVAAGAAPSCGAAAESPTARHLSLLGGALQASARSTRVQGESLVRLQLDHERGAAVLELCDPRRFNTLSSSMGRDAHRVVAHARQSSDLRALVLQGAGRVFCAGGNPYSSSAAQPLITSACGVLESTAGFVGMRTLSAPVVRSRLDSSSAVKRMEAHWSTMDASAIAREDINRLCLVVPRSAGECVARRHGWWRCRNLSTRRRAFGGAYRDLPTRQPAPGCLPRRRVFSYTSMRRQRLPSSGILPQ